jgi:hypothetical protein
LRGADAACNWTHAIVSSRFTPTKTSLMRINLVMRRCPFIGAAHRKFSAALSVSVAVLLTFNNGVTSVPCAVLLNELFLRKVCCRDNTAVHD